MSSSWRLFLTYAGASLVPVLLLGLVLTFALSHEARDRGIGVARVQAALVARTAIEPLVGSLEAPLTAEDAGELQRLSASAISSGAVVRLRLRDTAGRVIFSDDGSGTGADVGDEVLDAVRGTVVAHLTRLNSDRNDVGPAGPEVVEVYQPIIRDGPVLGVLEIYLPYDPIAREVSRGLHTVYLALTAGLAALWMILAVISGSTMRWIAHQAGHDALTGLPNRTVFQRHAAAAVEAARRDGRTTAVVLADVDRFKEVNDTLGHRTGDALLRELGGRLAAAVRSGDTVARLGGDEFGLVLPDIGPDAIGPLLDRLRAALEAEAMVGTLPLSPEASFGYALAPADGTDVDTLLRRADMAMYLAKGTRSGTARYDRRRDHYDAAQLALVAELRRAIENDELVLHYQPKAELRTGKICSVEALVRWRHPKRGLVAPDAFLPVAEQTGLIDPLTRWVLATALAQVVAWGEPCGALSVAVNVSARNLARADFADTVLAALADTGVPAARLVVEITETALMTDPAIAADVLNRLAEAGIRVSIDDFGQGQTSLGYLSTLPLHELKIDKSFVDDLPDNIAHAAIVRSMIDLGHNLGLQVVAEGVETVEVADLLKAAGCDIAQGYLVARPMPAGDLPPWLSERPAGQAVQR
ncbi:putative bifunctional diguanylate cyclase/phosphodiesterase [Actinoplanes sp. NPDC020271]|uniref:putative bifunctional diguanylate cyclase/phosphodiesterase n=1 Tax=Actinoplanes sp. NPDC020271 TaxID=3363896 RepID=UPI0037A7CB1B